MPASRSRRVGARTAIALALLTPLPASCTHLTGFTRTLPADLPSLRGWEKSSGWAELNDPRRIVEYELYVGPRRNAVYEVVRYRIRLTDTNDQVAHNYTGSEKLQWDVDGHDLRCYECLDRPRGTPGGGCEWRQMRLGSPEYERELSVILSIYGLHSRLLHEREEK